jgi:ribosome-binding protein aMBF1 (putative translation factor)
MPEHRETKTIRRKDRVTALANLPADMPLWRKDFSERVVEAIRNAGYSNSSLSRKAGLTPQNLSRILYGDVNPKLESVLAIADALGIPVSNLLQTGANGKYLF